MDWNSYAEYLKSDVWQSKRKEALENAKRRCQLCNGTDRLEVHHRVYSKWGTEPISDLTVLCHNCHYRFTKKKGRVAKKNKAIRTKPKFHYIPKPKKLSQHELKQRIEEAKKLKERMRVINETFRAQQPKRGFMKPKKRRKRWKPPPLQVISFE